MQEESHLVLAKDYGVSFVVLLLVEITRSDVLQRRGRSRT